MDDAVPMRQGNAFRHLTNDPNFGLIVEALHDFRNFNAVATLHLMENNIGAAIVTEIDDLHPSKRCRQGTSKDVNGSLKAQLIKKTTQGNTAHDGRLQAV